MPSIRSIVGPAVVAAALAGAALALWAGLAGQIVTAMSEPWSQVGEFGRDFAAFRQASLQVLDGQASAIYQFDAETIAANEGPARFANPPYFALFTIPFTGLDFLPGYILWTILGLLALAFGVRMLDVRVGVWFIATVLTVAGFLTVFYGQNSFFTFLLLSASYANLRAGRDTTGGVFIGLATYKPHLLAGFAVWLVVRLRSMWRVVAGLILTLGLLVGSSAIVMRGAWPAFVDSVLRVDSDLATVGSHLSLRHVTVLLLPDREVLALMLWLGLVVGIIGGQAWVLGRTKGDLPTEFSIAVVASLLLAPRGLAYDWILLAIPLALLWDALPNYRRTWTWLGLATAAAALFSVALTVWQRERFGFALQIAPIVLLASAVIGARIIADAAGATASGIHQASEIPR